MSVPCVTRRFSARTESGAFAAMRVAIACTASINSVCGTTLLTKPMRIASAALTRSPVSSISIASLRLIERGRRCTLPEAGMLPMRTSESAKLAFSEAMQMSQASASSMPPPIA